MAAQEERIPHREDSTEVRLTGRQHKKILDRLGEDVPLEVVTLLEIFARIEARRRLRFQSKQKVVD